MKKKTYRKNGTNSSAMKARWARLKAFESKAEKEVGLERSDWVMALAGKPTHIILNLESGQIVGQF